MPIEIRDPFDLTLEARLDSAIQPSQGSRPEPSRQPRVFLTGATGFVGAHLLSELLRRGASRITCLVRASSDEEGLHRIHANVEKFGFDMSRARGVVAVALGDLSAPRLGLSKARFEQLASETDLVIHNGAWVHLTHPYERLRAANVVGTEEILRLAVAERAKRFCHVSGMSVFLGNEQMIEDAPPADRGSHGGYFDTKWVSERLVWEAIGRGMPGSVARLGWTSGDCLHGRIGDSDAMTIFIRACVRMGMAPRLPRKGVECIPVDIAAGAIVEAAYSTDPRPGFNLWSSHRLPEEEIWARISALGRPISIVSSDDWLAELKRRFPLIVSVGRTILSDLDLPPVEDSLGRGLIARMPMSIPGTGELLDLYARIWAGKRTTPPAP